MKLNNITILVWDDLSNFNLSDTKRQFGDNKLYRGVRQFQSQSEFENILSTIDDEELIVVCCHVKYEDFSGFLDFRNSGIKENFNIPGIVYLSSADSGLTMQRLYDKHKIAERIILYSELIRDIKADDMVPFKVGTLRNNIKIEQNHSQKTSRSRIEYPQIDYAVITALYDAEFEEVKKIFNFNEEEIISTNKKEYYIGYLKSDSSKKIVVAIPSATGMVDSAIIATQMLEFFRPQYLMMSGVCGGKSGMAFGDIVVASSIFTFQKGKLSDLVVKDEFNNPVELELYDKNRNVIDYNHLYDGQDNQVNISIEKFEIEHDSIIELHTLIKGKIERKRSEIKDAINEDLRPFSKKIDIVIEPMACSMMVINKKGYFEDKIKILNRKTAAVEMESYGVARACMFANDGNTIPIIFKSVMDNMSGKSDEAKQFAAHTSAQFLKYLFEKQII